MFSAAWGKLSRRVVFFRHGGKLIGCEIEFTEEFYVEVAFKVEIALWVIFPKTYYTNMQNWGLIHVAFIFPGIYIPFPCRWVPNPDKHVEGPRFGFQWSGSPKGQRRLLYLYYGADTGKSKDRGKARRVVKLWLAKSTVVSIMRRIGIGSKG